MFNSSVYFLSSLFPPYNPMLYWHSLFMSVHIAWQMENTDIRNPWVWLAECLYWKWSLYPKGWLCCLIPVDKGKLSAAHSCLIKLSSFWVAMLLSGATVQTAVAGCVGALDEIQRLQFQCITLLLCWEVLFAPLCVWPLLLVTLLWQATALLSGEANAWSVTWRDEQIQIKCGIPAFHTGYWPWQPHLNTGTVTTSFSFIS